MTELSWSDSAATNTTPGSSRLVSIDVIRYVNKVDIDSGWLLVGIEGSSRKDWISLFKYCKVMLVGGKGGRTYFKILEGAYQGMIAFLSDANANEYLGKVAPKQKPIELVINYGRFTENWKSITRRISMPQQLASGDLGGIRFEVAMNTVWGREFYPIPPGVYAILLPDVPHTRDYTAQYKAEYSKLSHHQVWFPIDRENKSRYVHVGNVSEGCVTVLSLREWANIHETLVSHRGADGKSVATLVVKGKPAGTR